MILYDFAAERDRRLPRTRPANDNFDHNPLYLWGLLALNLSAWGAIVWVGVAWWRSL